MNQFIQIGLQTKVTKLIQNPADKTLVSQDRYKTAHKALCSQTWTLFQPLPAFLNQWNVVLKISVH